MPFCTIDLRGKVQCKILFGGFFVDHRLLSGMARYSFRPGHFSASYVYFENKSFTRSRLMSVFNFHAFSGCIVVPSEKIVNIGVFTLDAALMSSSNLGRPSVTFLALFPAL